MKNKLFKNIKDILKTKHYIKNFVVYLPILFSMNLTNYSLLVKECIMFAAFCLISSSVYIINDLIDIEQDKLHPVKCKRPLANGQISKNFAVILLIFLFAVSLFLGYRLNIYCFLALLSYFILNIFYSLKLKNIVIIDVVCIAFGFILRILSGCAAIWVVPSALIILLTFFVSLFFSFSKRKLELKVIQNKEFLRNSIKNCDEKILNQFILINAVLSIAFYFTYVLDEKTILRAGSEYLYITVIPFTLIFFRLLYLINLETQKDDPIIFIENDFQLKILILIFFITLIFLIV